MERKKAEEKIMEHMRAIDDILHEYDTVSGCLYMSICRGGGLVIL